MARYDFLLDTYDTERLKTVSVWSQFRDEDLSFRPEPRARTPLEQMVHQTPLPGPGEKSPTERPEGGP